MSIRIFSAGLDVPGRLSSIPAAMLPAELLAGPQARRAAELSEDVGLAVGDADGAKELEGPKILLHGPPERFIASLTP